MGKTKKNKKGLSEKIASKTKGGPAKLNPFNVRFVKSKHDVLGRKLKTDVGKPGLARAKAIQKRKETLLQEYQLKNKSNLFLDKRIGERDSGLSAEEKMIARFTAERVKGAGKSSIFNLGDDFNLTHGGDSLDKIDKFDNPHSDDDADQDELLSKQFVEEAHFGGFMSKADDEFKAGKGNTRKDFIDNLIKESKKKKAEKRRADEEAEEKTNALDDNWKGLLKNLTGWGASKGDEEITGKYDPYDMLVKQLTFEKKEARGGERLKTEEEKIKEERERLEKLEEDRQRRMKGEKVARSHVSVEDLGDENTKLKNKMSKKEKRKLLKQLLNEEEDDPEGEIEEEESGEDDEESNAEEEDSDDDDGESDEYSDLDDSDNEAVEPSTNEKDKFDKDTEEIIAAASEEIPYIISVPITYPALCTLVWDRPPSLLSTVLDRILACNHPQLGDHKPALITYYSLLLQLTQDLVQSLDLRYPDQVQDKLTGLGLLTSHMSELTGLFQQQAAESVLAVVKQKFDQWTSQHSRARYPGLDTALILHLVHLLFPTSDYRHPVVTPALTLACSVLSSARPTGRSSFSLSLLFCSSVLEYSTLSHRLCPELVGTLHGLLYVAGKGHTDRPLPPCKGGSYLVLQEDCRDLQVAKVPLSEGASVGDIDDQFRVNVMKATLVIILKVVDLYRDIPACSEVLGPLVKVASRVEGDRYPPQVVELLEKVVSTSFPAKKNMVVRPAKQVPMLRMLEPKVEEDFEPFKKKRTGNREMLEEQKMRHKLKQERKGARKEIRQDTAFLAAQKAKEARQKDKDRQEKTKAIFSNLANQEGDYNKLLKKKKKF